MIYRTFKRKKKNYPYTHEKKISKNNSNFMYFKRKHGKSKGLIYRN